MRRNSGLTLIEMVITLVITLMITGALLRVFVDSLTNQVFVESQNDAEAGPPRDLPSAEGLIEELEDFLRSRRDDDA